MERVTLKNGAEEAEALVNATMLILKTLMVEKPIALYELRQLCGDRDHRLFGNAADILEALNLVSSGQVHSSIRHIVMSATEGDGMEMRLVNPAEA